MYLIVKFFVLFFSIQAFSAEVEIKEEVVENKILLESECKKYVMFLNASLGCNLCHGVKSFFKTKKYKHKTKRERQIAILMAALNGNNIDLALEIFEYIINNMQPFNGIYGRSFYETTTLQVKKAKKNKEIEIKECVICMENPPSIIFFDCMHLATCFDCANRQESCPICRGPKVETLVLEEEKISNMCILCQKNTSNLLMISCKHLCACSQCQQEGKKEKCHLCEEIGVGTKIFRP